MAVGLEGPEKYQISQGFCLLGKFFFMKYSILLFCLGFVISAKSQDLVFKDKNFECAVLEYVPKIDVNEDGKIQKQEADSVKKLSLMDKKIQFMDDAYLFPNLEYLVLTNNKIKEVRLIGFLHLKNFSCAANQLVFAEIKNMPELISFALNFNVIDSLVLDSIPKLESFSAEGNKLKHVDLTKYHNLKHVSLIDNELTELDSGKNPEIIQIRISGNKLTELNISQNLKLKTHILYVDPTVKLITTPQQQGAINSLGLGKTLTEVPPNK